MVGTPSLDGCLVALVGQPAGIWTGLDICLTVNDSQSAHVAAHVAHIALKTMRGQHYSLTAAVRVGRCSMATQAHPVSCCDTGPSPHVWVANFLAVLLFAVVQPEDATGQGVGQQRGEDAVHEGIDRPAAS